MEVDAFDWPIVSFVNLNDMLRSEIVEFDFFIMRAGGNTISKGVKFDLMNDSRMLLIGLY